MYTSVEIANWLVKKNIIIIGTVQKVRASFPEELFDIKNPEVLNKTCHFEKDKKDLLNKTCHFEKDKKDLCLSSYTVQKKIKG